MNSMVKLTTTVAAIFCIRFVNAKPQDNQLEAGSNLYSARYNLDIDTILNSPRLVTNYVECLLNKKPCPPEGKDLKRILPEALRTKCGRCSTRQKEGALKVIRKLYYSYPNHYSALREKWDPSGEYHRRFLQYLQEEQFNQIVDNDDKDNQAVNVIPVNRVSPPKPSTTQRTTQRTTTTTTTTTTTRRPTTQSTIRRPPPTTPTTRRVDLTTRATRSPALTVGPADNDLPPAAAAAPPSAVDSYVGSNSFVSSTISSSTFAPVPVVSADADENTIFTLTAIAESTFKPFITTTTTFSVSKDVTTFSTLDVDAKMRPQTPSVSNRFGDDIAAPAPQALTLPPTQTMVPPAPSTFTTDRTKPRPPKTYAPVEAHRPFQPINHLINNFFVPPNKQSQLQPQQPGPIVGIINEFGKKVTRTTEAIVDMIHNTARIIQGAVNPQNSV